VAAEVRADTDDLQSFVDAGHRLLASLDELRQQLSMTRSMVAAELGRPPISSAEPAMDELLDHMVIDTAFVEIVGDALEAFDIDDDPMATVSAGAVDTALAGEGLGTLTTAVPMTAAAVARVAGQLDGDGLDPDSTVIEAAAAYHLIVADIDRGDDRGMSNGELNRVNDRLAALDPATRALVVDQFAADQLTVLFHNVHSSGWLSNDWDDGERDRFYTMLRESESSTLQRITNDPTLMADIAEVMSTDAYLDFLVAMNTDHGAGRFPSAAEADALIRTHIPSAYLATALADDRQAEGNLAIVDETNFAIAYAETRGGTPRGTLNGFVDSSGRQWVRAMTANPGTPVHEAIHNYSQRDLIETSQPLNEGVTEYFTRMVTDQTDDPSTAADEAAATATDRVRIYSGNLRFVERLVDVVGEDVVASAYFDGDVDGLKEAFLIETALPEASWDSMIADTRDNRWTTATIYLSPPSVP